MVRDPNEIDPNTNHKLIENFGQEWSKFDNSDPALSDFLDSQFNAYTKPIDLDSFKLTNSVMADFGAGSGRWTERFSPFFTKIIAVEPSNGAFEVLRKRFINLNKIEILQESIGNCSISPNSLDLAVALGVLHHVPDTKLAIQKICDTLKPGGTLLCYLYYKIENKPFYFQLSFQLANLLRVFIARLPRLPRTILCQLIAVCVYLPIVKFGSLLQKFDINIKNLPLRQYVGKPFQIIQNDSLDRFGTLIEHRFNQEDIRNLFVETDFDADTLIFSNEEPSWTFAIDKKS